MLNANSYILISIVILGLLAVFAAIFAWKYKTGRLKPNYKAFFILGLVFLPVGVYWLIREDQPIFIILSVIYTAMGITNKDKWDQSPQLDKKQKRLLMVSIAAGVLLLLLGMVFYLIYE